MKKRIMGKEFARLGALFVAFVMIAASFSGCSGNSHARELQKRLAESDGTPVQMDSGSGPRIPQVEKGDFYVDLEGRSCDFYPGDTILTEEAFTLYSATPLDLDSIRVEIPMKTRYQARFQARPGHAALAEDAKAGFWNSSVEAWLCTQDVDWVEFGQATRNMRDAEQRLYWKSSPDTEKNDQAILEDYNRLIQIYTDQAGEAAQAEDFLPEFYAVSILLTFDEMADETVESLDLTVDGQTRTIRFGQWRFHSSLPEDLGVLQADGVENEYTEACTTFGTPFDGGLVVSGAAFHLKTTKPVTLKRMWMDHLDTNLLGARATYSNADQTETETPGWEDVDWDCTSLLEIAQGQDLQISAVLYDPDFANFHTKKTGWIHLEYECDSVRQTLSLPYEVQMITNESWMIALQALYGYDLGPYFVSYYPEQYGYMISYLEWQDISSKE